MKTTLFVLCVISGLSAGYFTGLNRASGKIREIEKESKAYEISSATCHLRLEEVVGEWMIPKGEARIPDEQKISL